MTITEEQVRFLQKRKKDDIGRVFIWQGRVFRGIYRDCESIVRNLFSTGFIDEIMRQNCFPRTWMTDYKMKGFSLILEHERIWPIIYPQEWTFSMLKDAALLVCKVGLIARGYGLNMKDCHGLNILFDGVQPKFIDLGSFVTDCSQDWRPYEEFLRFYEYPLNIWRFDSFLGKLSIFSGNLTPHKSYWQYKYPFARRIRPNLLNRLILLFLRRKVLFRRALFPLKNRFVKERRIGLASFRQKTLGSRVDLEKLVKRVERISKKNSHSLWATYHNEIKRKVIRFNRITEIINGIDDQINTAVDIGGNQGRFSRLIVKQTNIKHVVCLDSDEEAIDIGYNRQRSANAEKISFANFDFMAPTVKLSWMLPQERFKADIAVALALIHHLMLSQQYDLHEILRNILEYTNKYVLIEFMPLGLWTSGKKPEVPKWYNIESFRRTFQHYFHVLVEEKIADNNILFLGKVRLERENGKPIETNVVNLGRKQFLLRESTE